MKKEKISLKEVKVQSFTTSEVKQGEIKGGGTWIGCYTPLIACNSISTCGPDFCLCDSRGTCVGDDC